MLSSMGEDRGADTLWIYSDELEAALRIYACPLRRDDTHSHNEKRTVC